MGMLNYYNIVYGTIVPVLIDCIFKPGNLSEHVLQVGACRDPDSLWNLTIFN